MNKNLIITILLVVIVGSAGFFGGMKYQQGKQPAFNRRGGAVVQGNNANRQAGFRPVAGEIISQDDQSITVKLNSGGSKIVLVTDKTEINQAAEATKTDLKTGEKVSVFGTENTDGSVTAENIQLNPVFRGQN